MAKDEEKVEINTAEDAVMAFLRKEISEDEFRDACAKYGVQPGTLFHPSSPAVERIDAAFVQTIPDDIYEAEAPPEDNAEARLKAAKVKQDERDKAAKESGLKTDVKEGEKLPAAKSK